MKIQGLTPGYAHKPQARPVAAPSLSVPMAAHVRFSAKGSAVDQEAQELMKSSKQPEVFIPNFYRGKLPLTQLSKVETKLPPERQARLDAYKTLIRVGMRSKLNSPQEDQKLMALVENPTPAVKAMMTELNITAEQLKTPVVDAFQIDKTNDIPPEVLQRASELGLLRLKIAKEYGGLGLQQREYGQVLETFADVSSSVGTAISAHSTLGSAPLMQFATEAQKDKYLKMFARGEAMAAFGLTEPGAGTDLNKLATTAKLSDDGKHWILNGDKIFITSVTDSGLMYVVSGKTQVGDKVTGPTVFLVELPFKVNESWETKKLKLAQLANQGLRITPFTREGFELLMIRGTDQGFIQMRDFKVPADCVLGAQGKGKNVPLNSLNAGRAGFGPYVTEAVNWFAGKSLEWAADRKMFDMFARKGEEGIQGNMEYISTKLGRMKIKHAALKAVSDMTSALIDESKGKDQSVAALSAAIKVRVTDQNWEAAQDALEVHGGHGLIKDSPNGIELAARDAWIPKIVEGVNPAMAAFTHLMGGKEVMREMATPKGVGKFIWNMTAALRPPGMIDAGVVPYGEARWIQKHTAQFARRFGVTAKLLGNDRMGRAQNTLYREYNVLMDLFTLAAVQIKLAKEKDTLSDLDKAALQAATKVLKFNIDKEMPYIRPSGHPIENLERRVGEAFLEKSKADGKAGTRENVVERHYKFLSTRADAFQAQIQQELAKSLAKSDGCSGCCGGSKSCSHGDKPKAS